jgi:hypothetical protein
MDINYDGESSETLTLSGQETMSNTVNGDGTSGWSISSSWNEQMQKVSIMTAGTGTGNSTGILASGSGKGEYYIDNGILNTWYEMKYQYVINGVEQTSTSNETCQYHKVK